MSTVNLIESPPITGNPAFDAWAHKLWRIVNLVGVEHSAVGAHTAASETAAGTIELATAAEVEAGTDTARAITPAVAHRHISAAKAWCYFNGTQASPITPLASYNVTGIVKNSTGNYTITWETDFSSANYCVVVGTGADGGANNYGLNAGTFNFQTKDASHNNVDTGIICVVAFGDQ